MHQAAELGYIDEVIAPGARLAHALIFTAHVRILLIKKTATSMYCCARKHFRDIHDLNLWYLQLARLLLFICMIPGTLRCALLERSFLTSSARADTASSAPPKDSAQLPVDADAEQTAY